ncbi:hypothetical protein [Chryseobacterium elymi]|nr:hypothetical protein [Chryseobacterium elymi]
MKNYLLLIILIGFTNLHSCQKNRSNNTLSSNNKQSDTIKKINMTIDEDAIKELYKRHQSPANKGEHEEEEDFYITEKDVDLMIPVLAQGLRENGFKALNNEEYRAKLKEIFNISDNQNCPILFQHQNFSTYVIQDCKHMTTSDCNENAKLMEFLYDNNVFFINKINAITSLPKVELFTKLKNDKIIVDIPNNIIYRNLFLFNNDNSKFLWLVKNDTKFMENLVKEFGYTNNTALLKWVIEKTKFDKNNASDYGKLFWTKNCSENMRLHANTFKLLQKLYIPNDPSENRFIPDNIKNYLEYLNSNENSEVKTLSKVEKLKIMANLAYFAEQYNYDTKFNDDNKMMARLRYFLNDDDFEIIKKNNYFSLPKFKEWWDNADYDEYFVTECEYEGSCGSGYQPMDYTEWRKQHPKK